MGLTGKPSSRQKASGNNVERCDQEFAAALAGRIVDARLATPALFLLESIRPLGFLLGQALHFFAPFGHLLIKPSEYDRFAGFLEYRSNLDLTIQNVESLCDDLGATEGKDRRP